MANTHISKLSYLGDPLGFEFPSSEESLLPNDEEQEKIERAGSIFIKSGMKKVSPFPTVSEGSERTTGKHIFAAIITGKGQADPANNSKTEEMEENGIEDNKSDAIVDKTFEKESSEKTRSNTEESHYEDQRTFLPQHSLIRKRASLRQVNSISSFVNPYLRDSLLRKHQKEIANDENLSKRVQSMELGVRASPEVADLAELEEEDVESEIDKDKLEIPRRSSKRIARLQSIKKWSQLTRNSSMASRNRNLSRSNTKKSVNTLANDPKRYRHSFKSVDLSGLDQILVELMNVKEGSAINTRQNSTHSKTSIRNAHENLVKDESSEVNVKPFNVSKSISRNRTLKRSITTAKNEMKTISEHSYASSEPSRTHHQETGLPGGKESVKVDSGCELKRSNAVKRKPVLIEYLLKILRAFKEAGKKCWRVIKSPTRKNVAFKGKKAPGTPKRGPKKKMTISEPVLVDIADTPFGSQVINMGDAGPASAASAAASPSSSAPSAAVSSGSSKNAAAAVPVTERLSTIASMGEDEKSKHFSVEDGAARGEPDRLEELWRQYLSATIRNRIDMKLDVSKLDYIERVKSIQSHPSRRESIERSGNVQVEKILDSYIVSAESSRASTITASVSSVADSMVTAPLYRSSSEAASSHTRVSTRTWATIDSDSDAASTSSVSTIEEESDFDGLRSGRSSVSSLDQTQPSEDVSDVYDDYSMLSDADDPAARHSDAGVATATGTVASSYTLGHKPSARTLKPSARILNLQGVLTRRNSAVSRARLGGSVYSTSVCSAPDTDRSDAFSFTRSVPSVCRV